MAHFAKLDNKNVVIDVNVVDNEKVLNLPFPESEAVGVKFLTDWSGGYTNWKQTSFNNNFRKRFACIGYTYDPAYDAFIQPRPHPSWVFNSATLEWDSPIPRPDGCASCGWDETTLSWIDPAIDETKIL